MNRPATRPPGLLTRNEAMRTVDAYRQRLLNVLLKEDLTELCETLNLHELGKMETLQLRVALVQNWNEIISAHVALMVIRKVM